MFSGWQTTVSVAAGSPSETMTNCLSSRERPVELREALYLAPIRNIELRRGLVVVRPAHFQLFHVLFSLLLSVVEDAVLTVPLAAADVVDLVRDVELTL